jgi:hypothetical protein
MTDDELHAFLPAGRKDRLAAAIGSTLADVERLLTLDPATFLEDERYREEDFFPCNSGPVQLRFDGGLLHVLAVWGEQLSIVVLDEPLATDSLGTLYCLSGTPSAPAWLRACLGRRCEDVRIWTFQEDLESEEAKQAAVSYLLAGGGELVYGIYIHGDLDSDYLLTAGQVRPDLVRSCYSLAQGREIDPWAVAKRGVGE